MSAPEPLKIAGASPEASGAQFLSELRTEPYSARTHGRPWIARVDFHDPKGDFQWGQWVGQSGEAGLLLIEVAAGDVVATGQKRFAGRGAPPRWWLVDGSGNLDPLNNRGDAFLAWRDAQAKRAAAPAPAAPAAPAPDAPADAPADSAQAPLAQGVGARGADIVQSFLAYAKSEGLVIQ